MDSPSRRGRPDTASSGDSLGSAASPLVARVIGRGLVLDAFASGRWRRKTAMQLAKTSLCPWATHGSLGGDDKESSLRSAVLVMTARAGEVVPLRQFSG